MSKQAVIPDPQANEPPRQRRRRMLQPLPPRDYLTRRELLATVPLCMSTLDRLEKQGIFPRRIRLEPTNRVVWKRREVMRFMEERARRRLHPSAAAGAAEPNTAA